MIGHMSRIYVFLIAGLALVSSVVRPASAQSTPFTEARFDSLQAADELILVDIWAAWCPVCVIQERALARYRDMYPDSPIHFLKVDFDSQKESVSRFKAPRQSTLILYRGEEQVWFSVAEMRDDVIFEALDDAVWGK